MLHLVGVPLCAPDLTPAPELQDPPIARSSCGVSTGRNPCCVGADATICADAERNSNPPKAQHPAHAIGLGVPREGCARHSPHACRFVKEPAGLTTRIVTTGGVSERNERPVLGWGGVRTVPPRHRVVAPAARRTGRTAAVGPLGIQGTGISDAVAAATVACAPASAMLSYWGHQPVRSWGLGESMKAKAMAQSTPTPSSTW